MLYMLDTTPADIEEMEHDIAILKNQIEGLEEDEDVKNNDRIAELKKELADKQEALKPKKAQWENEKASAARLSDMRKEIDQLKDELQIADRNQDYARYSEIQNSILPEKIKRLEQEEARVNVDSYSVSVKDATLIQK